MSGLTRTWHTKHPIHYALIPLAWCYRAIVAVRRWCYRIGLFKTTHFDVPVIVVGNLTVGGTGKTPAVIALVEQLKAQGKKPGIVSRGYKSNAKHYPAWVKPDSDPFEMGDEPVLIARRTGRPVVIAPKRVQAVRALLDKTDCDVVISDDGLQHYALGRDASLLVVDQARGFGNGRCLPAGPLREPVHVLSAIDMIILNQGGLCRPGSLDKTGNPKIPGQGAFAHNILKGVNSANMPPIYPMGLSLGTFQRVSNDKVVTLAPQKVHAIAGIGHPERFFETLRGLGFEPIVHTFPDHYRYRPHDVSFPDGLSVVMTEKDAVKCRTFADEHCYFLPITASLPDVSFYL